MVSANEAAPLPNGITIDQSAELDQQITQTVRDYRFALGAVVKINRDVRIDKEQQLSGELTRTTWEMPKSFDPDELLIEFRDQVVRQKGEILFECAGRDCGPSNIWANDLFNNADLLGRDDYQRYFAAKLDDQYLAAYAVRRGNRRVYLHLDQITEAEQSVPWLELLVDRGWVKLPDIEEPTLKLLADHLQDSQTPVRLVGHQQGADQGIAEQESERLVERVSAYLVERAGVKSGQLEVHGLGALAPSVLGADPSAIVVITK
jgi:phenylpyruvate tautomerase PptA (4-oxalocrotonate tautomerase family)